jgi:hypothetical protein
MAETGDEPQLRDWQTLRKRGRTSMAAKAVVSPVSIDVRLGRPPAPDRLTSEERELWERLTFARRPGWFIGSEDLLAEYCISITHVRRVSAAVAKARPGTGERYVSLMRQRRQLLDTAGVLATRLRLTPSSKLDKRTPQDGNLPVA